LLIPVITAVCFTCTVDANLPAPTGVAAEQVEKDGQPAVKVAWKPVGLAMYYVVYRSEQADGGFEYVGVSDGRSLTPTAVVFIRTRT
jgi:hypothetical protein